MPTRFRCPVKRHGSTVVIQAAGIMRLEDVATARQALKAEHDLQPATHALIDLRRAFISLSEDDWAALTEQSKRAMPASLPVGILVDPAYEAEAWRYCLVLMQQGMTRLPFIDVGDALAWAGLPRSTMPPTRPFQPLSSAGA